MYAACYNPMTGFLHMVVRSAKRRMKDWRKNNRTRALFEAGVVRLARQDYERVSIARIAREAGCSIGAFYSRFPDKDGYLYELIAVTFRTLAYEANLVLDGKRQRSNSADDVALHIMTYLVTALAARRTAGILRAASKLSASKPATLTLFQEYRSFVTERAIALLKPYFAGRDRTPAIRAAMQMAFATITDAILVNSDAPLKSGSAGMIHTLTKTLAGHIGLYERGWKGLKLPMEPKTDVHRGDGTDEPPPLLDGHIALYDPGEKVYRGSVGISRSSRRTVPKAVPRKRGIPRRTR